jgi:hypothetical protein
VVEDDDSGPTGVVTIGVSIANDSGGVEDVDSSGASNGNSRGEVDCGDDSSDASDGVDMQGSV